MKSENISRRLFLGKSAGAAIGAIGFPYIVSSVALGKGGVAASNRITVGCIGVGGNHIWRVVKEAM